MSITPEELAERIAALVAERDSLRAELAEQAATTNKYWTALLRRGVSEAPCDVCGYSGERYWQANTHRCIHDAAIIQVQDRAQKAGAELDALRREVKP